MKKDMVDNNLVDIGNLVMPEKKSLFNNAHDSDDGTLRMRVKTTLRNYIYNEHFKSGDKLTERELCTLTGASRSVLREVLVNLESSGLIERKSFRGFRVARLSVSNVEEIFELRSVLETFAAELFVERASDQEIAELKACFLAMEDCARNFVLERMRLAKEQYFDVLFTGARNPEIRRALEHVIDRVFFVRARLLSDPARRSESIAEFRDLTSALAARDKLQAREACLAHLESARKAIVERLTEERKVLKGKSRGSSAKALI